MLRRSSNVWMLMHSAFLCSLWKFVVIFHYREKIVVKKSVE